MFQGPNSSKNETFGTCVRDKIYRMNLNPGPGSYNIPKQTNISYSIGEAERKKFSKEVGIPGPGSY
jgi:hypothetical protein